MMNDLMVDGQAEQSLSWKEEDDLNKSLRRPDMEQIREIWRDEVINGL